MTIQPVHLLLIPAFPLLGMIINAFFGHLLPRAVSGAIACAAIFLSFVVSVLGFLTLTGLPAEERLLHVRAFTWISTGSFDTGVAFMLDPLSSVMTLVVTGIGFLIHVYSMGYMSHDERYHRFFVYMNMFVFFMLTLVLADNFLLMFVGWEGVGLCSYLLIGFWFKKKSAADAGKKAFIVNRVGDFGFLLGMLLIFATFGTLNFQDVFAQVAEWAAQPAVIAGMVGTFTVICLLLFIGATGKSAQIPLYVWLPDAMEGPTPVSALIHAATMVTAGVYMVARCHILFTYAPVALTVVAVVGALTAILAATIALVQNDIKRVLAYSTVSQLGYMFLACGVGAFGVGVFHLMTHAFFKALLFLGSGSVMHGLHNETDIRKMGGMLKWMPITGYTFLLGMLAIAGIPPLSGFFSKDEVLWYALTGPLGHPLLWLVAVITAVFTAFYMARLTFKTFFGKPRMSAEEQKHIHESPPSMSWVLIALAVGAAVVGFVNIPHALGGHTQFLHFLEPSVGSKEALKEIYKEGYAAGWLAPKAYGFGTFAGKGLEIPLIILTVVLASAAILLGRQWYAVKPGKGTELAAKAPGVYRTLLNKYYVDEFYTAVIVKPGMAIANFLWKVVDMRVIDGIVNATAWIIGMFSMIFRTFQTGYVRNYAVGMVGGAIIVIWVLTR